MLSFLWSAGTKSKIVGSRFCAFSEVVAGVRAMYDLVCVGRGVSLSKVLF